MLFPCQKHSARHFIKQLLRKPVQTTDPWIHPGYKSYTNTIKLMAAESSQQQKVVVHLRATGDAPILKQAKFRMEGSEKFAKVIDFLRRQLHRETVFVYVNSAFAPNPDELVVDLYNNFGFDGKLVVNYANSMAWG